MSNNRNEGFKSELKNIPESFSSYLKNSAEALDSAKKERHMISALFFIIILFLSCTFFTGGHLRGVDYALFSTESVFNELNLLRYVHTFSIGVSFLLGFMLLFVMFFIYVMTRFVFVKVFTKGIKASDVFRDSIIEFGMNSIPFIFLFLIGGVSSDLLWWLFYPIALFAFIFLLVMLARSVFDAVDREKQRNPMFLLFSLFIVIAVVLMLAFLLVTLAYILITLVTGIEGNIRNFVDGVKSIFDGIKSVFTGIGNWFKNLFSGK